MPEVGSSNEKFKKIISSYGAYAIELVLGVATQAVIFRACGLEKATLLIFWQSVLVISQTIVDFGTSMGAASWVNNNKIPVPKAIEIVYKIRKTILLLLVAVSVVPSIALLNLNDGIFILAIFGILYFHIHHLGYVFVLKSKVVFLQNIQALAKLISFGWVALGLLIGIENSYYYFLNFMLYAATLSLATWFYMGGYIPRDALKQKSEKFFGYFNQFKYQFFTTLIFNFGRSGLVVASGFLLEKRDFQAFSVCDKLISVISNLKMPLQQLINSSLLRKTGRNLVTDAAKYVALIAALFMCAIVFLNFYSKEILGIYLGRNDDINQILELIYFYSPVLLSGSLFSVFVGVILQVGGLHKFAFSISCLNSIFAMLIFSVSYKLMGINFAVISLSVNEFVFVGICAIRFWFEFTGSRDGKNA